MGHSPEPFDKPMDLNENWTQCPNNGYDILIANGDFIGAFVHDDTHSPLSRARCERACICVNACAGMADPAGEVKRLRDAVQRMAAELAHARGDDEESFYTKWRRLSMLTDANPIAKSAINTALSAKEAE